ncbi:hypothetical protein [Azohydromonas caseinilytica]|uniref:Uncharacterized protein n=1 Tax=Azohydromonas caseinilytica TaxID=2728836 RepID=A0A848FJX9_9BURK|nr:hypothetical protein [Azohydromonas caseinilytica]NML18101.1 hypothetical protein [Azohydromonas caseinilytica]
MQKLHPQKYGELIAKMAWKRLCWAGLEKIDQGSGGVKVTNVTVVIAYDFVASQRKR